MPIGNEVAMKNNAGDKKKILVILTGGTIGSRVENTTIDVTDSSSYELISLYRKIYREEDVFEVICPYTVLSENMSLKIWTNLIHALYQVRWEKYQGVIITHGSDTLAYTSALVGMLFSHIRIPIVLTAGNYPLGEEGSNGLVNFRSSVELIRTPGIRGVFTVYQNRRGENCVYLATRVTEADSYRDQFSSFGGSAFGRMENGVLKVEKEEANPSPEELVKNCEKRIALKEQCPAFTKEILMIRPYPGMNYEYIDLSNRPAAVLHYLYHSSTACTEGEKYSLPVFLKRCREEQIPVYTASYKSREGFFYITAQEILRSGAIPMLNISPEAAYMKLLLLYNISENVTGKMEENIYFEHLPALKRTNDFG